MQNAKRLSLQIAGAAALTMIFSASAFAESRHLSATVRGGGGHISRGESRGSSGATVNRDRSFSPSNRSASVDRGSISRGSIERRSIDRGSIDRGSISRNDGVRRSESRSTDSSRFGTREVNRNDWRGNESRRIESRGTTRNDSRYNAPRNGAIGRGAADTRFQRYRGAGAWTGRGTPYRGQSYYGYGRVTRYERWHNGYRCWIGGALYPIFVPFNYWHRFPLHIGLYIRFGGYWDPYGYWSVADYAPYDYYYDGGAYTRGEIRGIVESVDFRRGTMVINDDLSRQFVTVRMPRDRRLDDVRPGDYIEFSGDWTRSGVFDAYRVERLDYDRDGGRYER